MRIRLPGAEIFAPAHAVDGILRGLGAYCDCCAEARCITPYGPEALGLEGLVLACSDCCEDVHTQCRQIVEEVER